MSSSALFFNGKIWAFTSSWRLFSTPLFNVSPITENEVEDPIEQTSKPFKIISYRN